MHEVKNRIPFRGVISVWKVNLRILADLLLCPSVKAIRVRRVPEFLDCAAFGWLIGIRRRHLVHRQSHLRKASILLRGLRPDHHTGSGTAAGRHLRCLGMKKTFPSQKQQKNRHAKKTQKQAAPNMLPAPESCLLSGMIRSLHVHLLTCADSPCCFP